MNTTGHILFYTGSYTQDGSPALKPEGNGIGIFNFSIETGEIGLNSYQKQRNPSFLCISADNKYLFAVEELPEGNRASLFSYRISNDGRLELICFKKIQGGYACHLAICNDHLVISNYMSGNALVFEILENGQLSACKQLIQNYGTGLNKLRQESPHMHMAYPWGAGSVFLVDLGLDVADSYSFNKVHQKFTKNDKHSLQVDAGTGARHMVLTDDNSMVFVLGELSGEIIVFEMIEGVFIKKQHISYMADEDKGLPSGAAIKMHPNNNFLYASDRTTNRIAIFKINHQKKSLALEGFQDTGGKCPRDFEIDPSGNYMLVANQDSNNLVVFEVNKESGFLSKQSSFVVKTPVNICFQHLK